MLQGSRQLPGQHDLLHVAYLDDFAREESDDLNDLNDLTRSADFLGWVCAAWTLRTAEDETD